MATLIICLSDKCKAQINDEKSNYNLHNNYTVFGVETGYNFNVNRPIIGAKLGYRYENVFVSASMMITTTFNAAAPFVFPMSVGYNIGSFQPFLSYSAQIIGKEAASRLKEEGIIFKDGWRPGAGITYFMKSIPLSFTIQRQGKINSLVIGCYVSF